MPHQSAKSGSSSTVLVAAAVVAALLQLALAPQVSILGGAINFMVVLAAAYSMAADPSMAVYVGFFSGLFYDLTSSAPVGLMALLLTVASYAAANATQGMTPGLNADTLRIAGAYILIVNLANGAALLALGTETSIIYALGVHTLVSAVLDAVVAVPFIAVLGAHAQTGVFSGRGAARRTYATPGRQPARKRGAKGGRSAKGARGAKGGTYSLGKHAGKHASGKRSGGLRFK